MRIKNYVSFIIVDELIKQSEKIEKNFRLMNQKFYNQNIS